MLFSSLQVASSTTQGTCQVGSSAQGTEAPAPLVLWPGIENEELKKQVYSLNPFALQLPVTAGPDGSDTAADVFLWRQSSKFTTQQL